MKVHWKSLAGSFQVFCPILALITTADAQKITPYDTKEPNQFFFTQDVYYVDEDATNAIISVDFIPGDRSYSGTVDYYTKDGTAISGLDYTGVTNTLSFSGPAPPRTFTISIHVDPLWEKNETVQLFLYNTNAILIRSNATLVIIDKTPRPKLDVLRSNQTLTLSWTTNFTNFALQKSAAVDSTNWQSVSQTTNSAAGHFNVTTQAAGNGYFRLLGPTIP